MIKCTDQGIWKPYTSCETLSKSLSHFFVPVSQSMKWGQHPQLQSGQSYNNIQKGHKAPINAIALLTSPLVCLISNLKQVQDKIFNHLPSPAHLSHLSKCTYTSALGALLSLPPHPTHHPVPSTLSPRITHFNLYCHHPTLSYRDLPHDLPQQPKGSLGFHFCSLQFKQSHLLKNITISSWHLPISKSFVKLRIVLKRPHS